MSLLNFGGTNTSLLQLVEVFAEIAEQHGQIHSFNEGELYDFDAKTVTNYPTMFLQVEPSRISTNTVNRSVTLVVADLVNPDLSNRLDVLSDTERILYDVTYLLRDKYDLEPTFDISLKPLIEFKDDRAYGWQASFTIKTPQTFGWCDAPFKLCASGSTDYFGPYNINCGDNCISNLFYEDSASISFTGNGAVCDPLIANVNISATSGNGLVILGDGLYVSGGTGVPSIPSTQIAFGDDDNKLTSSPNFTWSGTGLFLTADQGITIFNSETPHSIPLINVSADGFDIIAAGAQASFNAGTIFIEDGSAIFSFGPSGLLIENVPTTVIGSVSQSGGNYTLTSGNMLLGDSTDNGSQLQVTGDAYFNGTISLDSGFSIIGTDTISISAGGEVNMVFSQFGPGLVANSFDPDYSDPVLWFGNNLWPDGNPNGLSYGYIKASHLGTIIYGTQPGWGHVFEISGFPSVQINTTGNVVIGGGSDNGNMLQVNGSAFLLNNVTTQTGYIWAGTNLVAGQLLSWGDPSGGACFVDGRTDGVISMYDSSESTFNILTWGAPSSSNGAIKVNGTGLQVVLADDSGDTKLTAASYNASAQFTPSGSGDAAGDEGDISFDDSFIYYKASTGWVRAALTTF